jgi:hypothetical protein
MVVAVLYAILMLVSLNMLVIFGFVSEICECGRFALFFVIFFNAVLVCCVTIV